MRLWVVVLFVLSVFLNTGELYSSQKELDEQTPLVLRNKKIDYQSIMDFIDPRKQKSRIGCWTKTILASGGALIYLGGKTATTIVALDPCGELLGLQNVAVNIGVGGFLLLTFPTVATQIYKDIGDVVWGFFHSGFCCKNSWEEVMHCPRAQRGLDVMQFLAALSSVGLCNYTLLSMASKHPVLNIGLWPIWGATTIRELGVLGSFKHPTSALINRSRRALESMGDDQVSGILGDLKKKTPEDFLKCLLNLDKQLKKEKKSSIQGPNVNTIRNNIKASKPKSSWRQWLPKWVAQKTLGVNPLAFVSLLGVNYYLANGFSSSLYYGDPVQPPCFNQTAFPFNGTTPDPLVNLQYATWPSFLSASWSFAYVLWLWPSVKNCVLSLNSWGSVVSWVQGGFLSVDKIGFAQKILSPVLTKNIPPFDVFTLICFSIFNISVEQNVMWRSNKSLWDAFKMLGEETPKKQRACLNHMLDELEKLLPQLRFKVVQELMKEDGS